MYCCSTSQDAAVEPRLSWTFHGDLVAWIDYQAQDKIDGILPGRKNGNAIGVAAHPSATAEIVR